MSNERIGGYFSVLPVLAELDPAFAAQALDRSRLVAAVEGDPALTSAERERQLSVLGSRFYARCLCNALVLILEALANNQFAQIGELLALPEIHADSYWNGLMPKILLATLYRKVVIVRDLDGRPQSGLWSSTMAQLQSPDPQKRVCMNCVSTCFGGSPSASASAVTTQPI